MNITHNNQPNKFEPNKNNRLNPREAVQVRGLLTMDDSALGVLFGVTSRYQQHHEYQSHPVVTAGDPFEVESLGMSEAQRIAEVDQLNAAFNAPAAFDPQPPVNEMDLDLAAIRARVAAEADSNA